MSNAMKVMVATNVVMNTMVTVEQARIDGKITPDEYGKIIDSLTPGLDMLGLGTSFIRDARTVIVQVLNAKSGVPVKESVVVPLFLGLLDRAGIPIERDLDGGPAPEEPDEHEGPTTQA